MTATIAEIRARDGDRCAKCGSANQLHVHHRIRRSQGGADDSCNRITLCSKCHSWCHQNPMAARKLGLLLSRHTDPATVPVDHVMWPSGPVLLGPELDFILWDSIPTWERNATDTGNHPELSPPARTSRGNR